MDSKYSILIMFGIFLFEGCLGPQEPTEKTSSRTENPIAREVMLPSGEFENPEDNAANLAIDCTDLGNLYHPAIQACPRPGAERGELCRDGIDNDGDGRVDCLDWDCRFDLWNEECEASLAGLASAHALRVATWNLQTFPKSEQTVEAVARVIHDMNPDVLAIQEVTSQESFVHLLAALPEYQGVSLSDLTGKDYWIQNVFLFKSSRFPRFEAEVLFNNDSYYFPRPVLHLTLWRTNDLYAQPWELFGVHLKAMGGSQNQFRRLQAIQKIAQTIHGLTMENPEARVIVLGDFNDKLLVPEPYNVFSGLFEILDLVVPATLAIEEAFQYTQLSYRSMIDHVFLGASLYNPSRVPSCQVLPLNRLEPGYASLLSDHLPVMCFVALGIE